MKKNKIPVVEFDNVKLSENGFNSDGNYWAASTLVQYCKEKDYPVFDLPLAGIRLDMLPWGDLSCIYDYVYHTKRVVDVDASKPIILDGTGCVCDGWHRIAKALLHDKETIKAIRIQKMPAPDGERNNEE